MTDELKPVKCGCGGEAEVIKHTFHGAEPCYGVTCKKCGTASWHGFDTDAEAITAWNRAMGTDARTLMKVFAYDATCAVCEKKKERIAKVETVEKPNVFKCSECGQYFHRTAWSSPVNYCSSCGARLEWKQEDE